MSLTRPVPKKVKEQLSEDPFMLSCCLASTEHNCEGRIQWHHHLKYGGKRQDEPWGILPVCELHHRLEAQFKNELDKLMVWRATEEQLKPYCKATDYITLKRKYENKH
jgi:hypothetical protein